MSNSKIDESVKNFRISEPLRTALLGSEVAQDVGVVERSRKAGAVILG